MPRLALAAALLLIASTARAENPVVIDGDTIRLGGTTFRLYGIDAPEKTQVCHLGEIDWLCGQEAAKALRTLIADQPIVCEAKGTDIYGRTAAVCSVGDLDLNREMVRIGMAWAYVYYSRDYEDSESEARILSRGVWASDAQPPWEWRQSRRRK